MEDTSKPPARQKSLPQRKSTPAKAPHRVQKPAEPQQAKAAVLTKENKALRIKIAQYETTLDTLNERLSSLRAQHVERVRDLEAQISQLEAQVKECEQPQAAGEVSGMDVSRTSSAGDRDRELEDARDAVARMDLAVREAEGKNRRLRVALESLTTLVPVPGLGDAGTPRGGAAMDHRMELEHPRSERI